FFFLGLLPPPAARSLAFSWRDRAGAGSAANAEKPAVLQLVVRDPVLLELPPHVLARPRGQRIELENVVSRVPLRDLELGPGHRLVPSQARDPGVAGG